MPHTNRRGLWGRCLVVGALLSSMPVASADGPRVLVISIDGLRPDAITVEAAPNLAALRESGASAERAINDLPSATLPNHTSMLTGVVGDIHGVVADFTIPGKVKLPTIFDVATAAGKRCAFFASKTKLRYLAPDDALETIDIDGDMIALVDRFVAVLRPDGPDLLFLHLRDPDSTGHVAGWMSPPYLAAVTQVDALIGHIVTATQSDPTRPTYILVTADHGGEGTNHFLNTSLDREIPWFVNGPDIAAGATLRGAISIVDTAPTALWLLGVPVPADLSGVARTALKGESVDSALTAPTLPAVGIPCLILVIPALACGACGLAYVARAARRA